MKIRCLHILMMLALSPSCFSADIQSIADIQAAVRDYVYASLSHDSQNEVEVTAIDTHLQLPLCKQELQIFPQSGDIKPGRNTLGVRCTSSEPWMIYTTATVKSFKPVVVLSKPMRRNEVIHDEDVTTENRDLSTLVQGYLLDRADVINKQAARNLIQGTVLNKLNLQEQKLIKRGENVNIQLGKAGMNISMQGIALMDGAKGDKINVKNVSSQKVIQAVVLEAGQVTVNF